MIDLLVVCSGGLCLFAKMLDPLRHNDSLEASLKDTFSNAWRRMVRATALYLVSRLNPMVVSFVKLSRLTLANNQLVFALLAAVFLYRLARYLDGAIESSFIRLVFPVLIINALALVASPPLFLENAKLETFRRSTELAERQGAEEAFMEAGALALVKHLMCRLDPKEFAIKIMYIILFQRRALRAQRTTLPIMQSSKRNLLLVRQTSTMFTRAKGAVER
jgi:hypothetical protein